MNYPKMKKSMILCWTSSDSCPTPISNFDKLDWDNPLMLEDNSV